MDSEQAADAVRDFFDSNDFKYDYHPDKHCITTDFPLMGKLKRADLFLAFRDYGYIVYAISPLSADPDNIGEMLRYLSMANYSLPLGNFEIDVRDGEIRFKCHVSTLGLESLPEEIIHESIAIPLATLSRYGDGIAALAMGFSDADTEIAKVEGNDGE